MTDGISRDSLPSTFQGLGNLRIRGFGWGRGCGELRRAYLDGVPDYDEAILEEWRREKEEQFEEHWPQAESILADLRRYGVYYADVNPGNIGFVSD